MTVNKDDVMNALRECYDPEIPLNIVDLGLVYDVQIKDDDVYVKMTLTAPGCPMHGSISEDVKSRIQAVAGVKSASVEIVWDPPWSPERMSLEAKKQFGYA